MIILQALAMAVNYLARILILLIIVRAILSWFRPARYNRLYHEVERWLEACTEPILAPIRRALPPVGPGIDLSPLVAVILIDVVRGLVVRLLLVLAI